MHVCFKSFHISIFQLFQMPHVSVVQNQSMEPRRLKVFCGGWAGVPNNFRVCPVHGLKRAWSCCISSEHHLGTSSENILDLQVLFHVVQWFSYWHQLDSLASARYMHCSLTRFCAANPQLSCPFAQPICSRIQTGIFLFLDVFEGHRVSLTCLIFFVDRQDLFLLVTEQRLGIVLSSFSVATPPLAAWPPAGRTISDFSSDSSSEADLGQ